MYFSDVYCDRRLPAEVRNNQGLLQSHRVWGRTAYRLLQPGGPNSLNTVCLSLAPYLPRLALVTCVAGAVPTCHINTPPHVRGNIHCNAPLLNRLVSVACVAGALPPHHDWRVPGRGAVHPRLPAHLQRGEAIGAFGARGRGLRGSCTRAAHFSSICIMLNSASTGSLSQPCCLIEGLNGLLCALLPNHTLPSNIVWNAG